MHVLLVGIEHLMTGIQIKTQGARFERESASVIRVTSHLPIEAYWPVNGAFMMSTDQDVTLPQYSAGEAEHYAQVVGPALVDIDLRSYDMQTYTRTAEYYYNGDYHRLAETEPSRFPEAVIKSMRRKWGAKANEWLAKLRWSRDHWFFHHASIYHGVEPDGHIHT